MLVLAILFPLFYDPLSGFLDATTTALAYVVMALGLNIVVGFAGLLDLGYVAFFAIGAYTMGWLGSGFYSTVNHGKGIHVLTSTFASHLPGIHINFILVLVAAGRSWVDVDVPAGPLADARTDQQTGTELVPGLTALGMVGLAGVVALAATRRTGRP